jgi:hypothetical protein
MDALIIEKTDSSPFVECKEGSVLLEGIALPEDTKQFFTPVLNWISNYKEEKIEIDVKLYYFNTAVSKMLYEIFVQIEDVEEVKDITINWHYEEGDEDILESGETYESMLERSKFNFIELAEMV